MDIDKKHQEKVIKALLKTFAEYYCIDVKRPFGNSDIEGDLCDILGLKANNKNIKYCEVLWESLPEIINNKVKLLIK